MSLVHVAAQPSIAAPLLRAQAFRSLLLRLRLPSYFAQTHRVLSLRRGSARSICLLIAIFILLVGPNFNLAADEPERVVGAAVVTDGDSIRIEGTRIRLDGIDAPERRQKCKDAQGKTYPCGQISMQALKLLVKAGDIRCIKKGSNRYGRLLAQCFAGDIDLSAKQVQQGWAVAYRKYDQTYVTDEKQARDAKLGMWAGTFEMPWNWRRKNR